MSVLSKSMAMSTMHECWSSLTSIWRSPPSSVRAVWIVAGPEQSLQYIRLQYESKQLFFGKKNDKRSEHETLKIKQQFKFASRLVPNFTFSNWSHQTLARFECQYGSSSSNQLFTCSWSRQLSREDVSLGRWISLVFARRWSWSLQWRLVFCRCSTVVLAPSPVRRPPAVTLWKLHAHIAVVIQYCRRTARRAMSVEILSTAA